MRAGAIRIERDEGHAAFAAAEAVCEDVDAAVRESARIEHGGSHQLAPEKRGPIIRLPWARHRLEVAP